MANRTSTSIGRWRRRVGVGMFTIGVALAVTFLVSARWWFGYCSDSWLADLGDGTLYTQVADANGWSRPLIGWCGGDNRPSGSASPFAQSWTWWTWGARPLSWEQGSAYTVWPVAPVLMIAGAALGWPGWVAARRMRRGQCPSCGYSRAGLSAESLCPECGRPAAAAPRG